MSAEARISRYAEAVALVESGEAPERVEQVVALVRHGLTGVEIAELSGLSRTRVYSLLNDPLGKKEAARKAKRFGYCADCGQKVTNAGSEPPKRCITCERTRNLDRNERLIEMWEADATGEEIAAELEMSPEAVRGWVNAARRRHGLPVSLHRRRNRELWPLIERLAAEGKTMPEIADECETTYDNMTMMVAAMREAGICVTVKRQLACPASPEQIAEAFDAGLSDREAAERLGYANVRSFQERVRQLRRDERMP